MESIIINVVLVVILLAIAGGIIAYLWRAKRRGDACIGCPHGKQCSGKCGSCNGCHNDKDNAQGRKP